MRLATHFDCSCIYRQYRNNFDQKLQNKSEKLIKTFVSASHISDEFVWIPSYVCRKFFSSGSYRENLAFFSPWNLLLNSCSTEAKSEWTFFLGLRWIKLVSAPRQHRSAFESELNLLENVPFFQLGDRNQGHSYKYTRAYLKKSVHKEDILH